MKTQWFLIVLTFICFSTLTAQDQDADLAGEIVVQLYEDVNPRTFFQTFKKEQDFPQLVHQKVISDVLHLHLLYYPPHLPNSLDIVDFLNGSAAVKAAGPNFRLKKRGKTPDDPRYLEQWGLETINAPDVWDFATGGLTALGDTIVIANLEGVEAEHPDLQDNLWYNWAETPNDGIDNDGNGYIDDFQGLRLTTIPPDAHGTSVAGILAAKGDNGMGITGVTWNTKLMTIQSTLAFDEIAESYMYVYDMRKRYNETNGAEGAFVVVTNASLGADRQFPEDNPLFPAWCAAYDLLGEVGVLSAGATSNDNINIDVFGDMPSTCSSEFLISVTNINKADQLDGAFSQDSTFNTNGNFIEMVSTYVDLAAPGTGSVTTKPNGGYGAFGGTSASTPHVAGTIALLYSLPCVKIAEEMKIQPQQTASLMRDFILQGVFETTDLEGQTVSGGRLDALASMQLIQSYCGGSNGPLEIVSIFPNPVRPGDVVRVVYLTPDPTEYDISIYNML
ncbi:MAG: S8 family serine peptidase, partial [Bacteroidota bacterium]